MSLLNSFNKIKRSAGIKKCVIIDGNVGDVYLDEKNNIVTLREYLEQMFKDMDYKDIVYWDRVEGATGAIDKLTVTDDVEVSGDAYELEDDEPQQTQGLFKEPAEIFNIVYKNVINKNNKVAFILNWSEYLFGVNELSEEGRQNITLLGKALKDRPIDYLSPNYNESVVVIILNKLSGFPISFYQGNPEVEIVKLQNPDRPERQKMLEKIEYSFDLRLPSGTSSILDKANAHYIDMLEDFTNREIIQLSKLSRKESKMTFDKLFYLFKYGEKDNPWEKLDYNRVKNIKKELQERVVGQEEAIEKIETTVVKAYMGLTGLHKTSSRSMPKGVFFFVGPTGVGKTELSKALAKFLFGDEQACIRFDMSEYAQENSDQKLIGAPPGYVGYEEGGQLTEAIRRKPYSIVLLDEIEKAHPDVLNVLLQIMDDGRITDSKGVTVDFKNTIIIMTSNLGSQYAFEVDETARENHYIDEIEKFFRPEFVNRIDEIIIFNTLTKDVLVKIADKFLNQLKDRLSERDINIEFTKECKNHVVEAGFDPVFGARPMKRHIQRTIETKVAKKIIEEADIEGNSLIVDYKDNDYIVELKKLRVI